MREMRCCNPLSNRETGGGCQNRPPQQPIQILVLALDCVTGLVWPIVILGAYKKT